MKLVITGGAGFVGCNFVQYMVSKYTSWDIITVDLLILPENLKNLESIEDRPNYKFVKGDITDRSFVFQLFETVRPDIVVNFAEVNQAGFYGADADVFNRNNVTGTVTLLEACRRYGIRRYHQVSTDRVYDTGILDSYSVSKASGDLYALACYKSSGLPVTVSRSSSNFGPYHSLRTLIPMAIVRAFTDREIPMYTTGETVCDWLHVSDHCRAIDLILQEGQAGEVYDISGHNERTNLMAVKTILKVLDKSESLLRFVKDYPADKKCNVPVPSKLENELGWTPSYDFETGIRQTIRWFWNNQSWWNSIELNHAR
ncbi:dTDP-glucose 4,6-dehydratase [Lacrimispora sp. 38-1]|uniref:dTDP-glucose 4,6-dehydratase n=1 Tax=Lacrimispora sp. 38-1 TaxID=3125778 RepID=UPI003CEE325D